MFKWFGQRHETKKQETQKQPTKQLWGKEFNIVNEGLDEEQVVSFVNDLVRQHKASSSASFISYAEQTVASIKMKAQTAEEEATRIITQANRKAEEIKRRAELASEKTAEDIISAASRKAEIAETEAKQKAPLFPLGAREKIEEPVQARDETTVSEPAEVATEEPLEPPLPEERPDREETGSDLLKQSSQTLYAGHVGLAIGVPVNLKMVSRLYDALQTIPGLRIVHTKGSVERGTTITVALDEPTPLISVILSKVPGVKVTPELEEKEGLVTGKSSSPVEKGVRRIKLALK